MSQKALVKKTKIGTIFKSRTWGKRTQRKEGRKQNQSKNNCRKSKRYGEKKCMKNISLASEQGDVTKTARKKEGEKAALQCIEGKV